MVGRDVRDHGHVVGQGADPTKEDPSTSRLQHGEVDARLGQGPSGSAEPRVIALFDELLVQVHAVGGGVGNGQPRRAADMRQ